MVVTSGGLSSVSGVFSRVTIFNVNMWSEAGDVQWSIISHQSRYAGRQTTVRSM